MRRVVQCVKPCISSTRNSRWIKTCITNQAINQAYSVRSFSAHAWETEESADDAAFMESSEPLPSLKERVRDFQNFGGIDEASEDQEDQENQEELGFQAPTLSERFDALPQLYTLTPIQQHDEQTVNQYFLFSAEQLARVPTSLKKALDVELSLTDGYMMARESYLPLIKSLSNYNTPKGHYTLRKPLGIDGKAGTGKTATLYYLYQWAVANNWLTIHIKAEDFMSEKFGWLSANTEREGIMDQPIYTQVWLKQVADLQSAQLARIPVTERTNVDWTPLDNQTAQSESRTLLDLINLSIVDVSQAARILYQLVDELRHQKEVPVLVLIDNLNAWDSVSDFIDPTNHYKPLPARRLALVDAWSVFQHVSPALGTSVFATTSHANQKHLPAHFNLNKIRATQIQPYNDLELKHALVHYNVSGALIDSVDEELIGLLKGLSGSLPKEVHIIAKHM